MLEGIRGVFGSVKRPEKADPNQPRDLLLVFGDDQEDIREAQLKNLAEAVSPEQPDLSIFDGIIRLENKELNQIRNLKVVTGAGIDEIEANVKTGLEELCQYQQHNDEKIRGANLAFISDFAYYLPVEQDRIADKNLSKTALAAFAGVRKVAETFNKNLYFVKDQIFSLYTGGAGGKLQDAFEQVRDASNGEGAQDFDLHFVNIREKPDEKKSGSLANADLHKELPAPKDIFNEEKPTFATIGKRVLDKPEHMMSMLKWLNDCFKYKASDFSLFYPESREEL